MKRQPACAAVLTVVMAVLTPPSRARATGPEQAADGADGALAPDPSPPSPPSEDAPPETHAEYWFGRGEALGEAGDFVGAAKAFERSVATMRTGEGLYNRALAYEYASMYLEAYAAYEDYRAFVDPRSTEARAAKDAIARVRAKVGTIELRFQGGHVPARIFVDGDPRARDEFPLLVMPGEHEVVVLEKSGEERRRSYTLAPGGVWTVDFTRPTETVPAPAFKPPPQFDELERERRRRIVRGLFYSGVGLTAAAGVTLGVFGGLTVREHAAFSAGACGDADSCEDAGFPAYSADHERNFNNYKLTTNVMVGVTAGLAGVTLVLGIIGYARPKGDAAAATSRIRIDPTGLRMRF